MRSPRTVVGVFASLLLLAQARAVVVSLAPLQTVTELGAPLAIDVEIAYQGGEPTTLFSFGVRIDVSGPGEVVLDTLTAVPALDFFGTAGPGAFIDAAPGVLGIKGSVDVLGAAPPHAGGTLARYVFSFAENGRYTLTPRAFNTLGPTEDIFVSGNGLSLDDSITFEPTSVTVVPEPGSASLLGVAGLAAMLRRRRPAAGS